MSPPFTETPSWHPLHSIPTGGASPPNGTHHGQTNIFENITFPQLGLRAINIQIWPAG